MAASAYKRVLLKLSGESLKGDLAMGTDREVVDFLAHQILDARTRGCEVAIVVGGGNLVRGRDYDKHGMTRATTDYAGMMATIINGLILQQALTNLGVEVRTSSSISVNRVAEPFIPRRAVRHLEKGRVVIFVAGTGSPFMTTDTAASLRALEINADLLLFAKHGADGIYDADPRVNKNARHIPQIAARDVLSRQLEVMDPTALTLCIENKMPMVVFDIFVKDNMRKILEGKKVGTLVTVS